MKSFIPGLPWLSEAQRERLAVLEEEMAEALQMVGKILRFGLYNAHPKGGATNRDRLAEELGHVAYAKKLLCNAGDIDGSTITRAEKEKAETIQSYLYHQEKPQSVDAEKHLGCPFCGQPPTVNMIQWAADNFEARLWCTHPHSEMVLTLGGRGATPEEALENVWARWDERKVLV